MSELLRVHRVTVLRWVRDGRLLAYVMPGPIRRAATVRIPVENVRKLLTDQGHGLADELAEWMERRETERAPSLCPRCGRRSIDATSSAGWCTGCTVEAQIAEDERREREKARQRRWWTANGAAWRQQRREAATSETGDA